MSITTTLPALSTFTMATLAHVTIRLADNGMIPMLSEAEMVMLATADLRDDSVLEMREHAFRMVVTFRWEWIVNNNRDAFCEYMNMCEDGCMWAAIVHIAGMYEAEYLANVHVGMAR